LEGELTVIIKKYNELVEGIAQAQANLKNMGGGGSYNSV